MKELERILSERRGSITKHILVCSLLMYGFLWNVLPLFRFASFFEQMMLSLGSGTPFFFLFWTFSYIIFRRADIYPLCIFVESIAITGYFVVILLRTLF